jgi:ribosomal protein L19E
MMARINARGAEAIARVKWTFTIEDGTVVTQHRVLCSDGRILERTNFRESDGRKHATGYRRIGKTTAQADSWVAAQLATGWKRE